MTQTSILMTNKSQSLSSDLSPLGGTETTINSVVVSTTAWNRYRTFNDDPTVDRDELCKALRGLTIRRMSDNSPYWIFENETLRYVLVSRKKGSRIYPESLGHFCLVNVQEVWKK